MPAFDDPDVSASHMWVILLVAIYNGMMILAVGPNATAMMGAGVIAAVAACFLNPWRSLALSAAIGQIGAGLLVIVWGHS